ncbi:MAG TPA: EAL domain-containing protein [Methylothermaceae bacterium]|nr:EAL domain-containing protein [Methylothermaceae bacterium]
MKQMLAIVDDEPELGQLLCEMAAKDGFDPLYFENGSAFIEFYRSHPNLNLVILDLLMPEMDGVEVLRKLAELDAEIGIILVSGYDESVLHAARRFASESCLNILASFCKPVRFPELKQMFNSLSANTLEKDSGTDGCGELPRHELQQAIDNDDLRLHYQPKIQMRGKQLVGVEVLVRWQHPHLGLLPPKCFIPLAEREDLIGDLTEWVLRQAVGQLSQWPAESDSITLAVNVSSQVITHLSLPEHLALMIQERQLNPLRITLEITESALMEQLIPSLDILTRLRMKGFYLSIDDFGTGYSSMVQLHRIPFTELKIDRSFIFAMKEDAEARAIVESCILLGKKLGMTVVAEGVEDQITWDLLEEMGCDIAQGFFMARPMPFHQLNHWLQHNQIAS